MTIPYMMNCEHSGEGWCIACVKSLGEELEAMTRERDALIDMHIVGFGPELMWEVYETAGPGGTFKSYDEAVNAVREAAGLTEEPR